MPGPIADDHESSAVAPMESICFRGARPEHVAQIAMCGWPPNRPSSHVTELLRPQGPAYRQSTGEIATSAPEAKSEEPSDGRWEFSAAGK